MKILVVNRNYFITGGPEKYMFSLMENMPHHKFIPFCVDFEQNYETSFRKYFVSPPIDSGSVYYKDFKMSPVQKLAYAVDSIYHMEARRKLEKLIKDERPDVALFLNAVYFSESIIDACRVHNVPIIWRLSDFNKLCSSYLLYRDGHVCEECLERGLTRAIRNRCGGYQRSLGASLIKVAGMWLSRFRRLYEHVDYFVTPSSFTREKMIQGGFRPEQVMHIPTMISLPAMGEHTFTNQPEFLYVGRLSHEKGVETLLEAFKFLECDKASVLIAGEDTSPYAQQLKATIPSEIKNRIKFLGFQKHDQISKLFRRTACCIVPSVCYENQPNAVLEGMAHSRPAIVSDLGSMKELIEHGKTGFRFEVGNARDLAAKMDLIVEDPGMAEEMGLRARDYVEKNHSLQSHLSLLEALFEKCSIRKSEVRQKGQKYNI